MQGRGLREGSHWSNTHARGGCCHGQPALWTGPAAQLKCAGKGAGRESSSRTARHGLRLQSSCRGLVQLGALMRGACALQVITDPITGRSKGYGFVRFGNEGERDRSLNEMMGHYIASRPIRVSLATAKKNPGGLQACL